MKEHKKAIGDTGRIIIRDFTDSKDRMVEVLLQSLVPVSARVLWYVEFGGTQWDIKPYAFRSTTVPQRVFYSRVGYAQDFTFYLKDTGTNQLGRDDESFNVELTGGMSTVKVRVNGVYRTAVAYVKDQGVWKPVDAYVNDNGTWRPTI